MKSHIRGVLTNEQLSVLQKNNLKIDLPIDKDEVLRYLGYQDNVIDQTIEDILNASIHQIQAISDMSYIYTVLPMKKTKNKILLDNNILKLTGKDIYRHLKDSEQIAIMATSLGFQVEKKIKQYSISNLTKGLILDACASTMIEELCDYVEKDIESLAIKEGYQITSRYSPGYGDLPLSVQPDILSSLNAQNLIGLTVTDSFMLLPRKSVTALIGFTKQKTKIEKIAPTAIYMKIVNIGKEEILVLNKLKTDFLFFDGAMGTMLQLAGLKAGELPESYNIEKPDIIYNIHKQYLKAGSDIITTNTFGANRLKLKNTPFTVEAVITCTVNIGKKAIGGEKEKYIALDIGPIGSLLEPLGTISFQQAYEIFQEQILYGVSAGADLILIETISDLYEMKAAILAAKENSNLPVFASMTFQDDSRTFTGTDPITMVSVLEGLGVDVLGVNCSTGPENIQPIVNEILKYSQLPIMVQPNAGLPKMDNGNIYYDLSQNDFSLEMKSIANAGASVLGGCCGTTPSYIKAMVALIKGSRPNPPLPKRLTTATSASKTVIFDNETKIIGERINPTGKKALKRALKAKDIDYILREAIIQEETGSDILDINVGLPEIDEKDMMIKIISQLQSIIATPLQIDSSDKDVIEAGARIYNGKPIINSVNGKQSTMDDIFPIVKKYGALVIGLTLDEEGIPKTAEKRFEIASKIIEKAESYGIAEENILIDTLVLTASAEQGAVLESLKAIPLIKSKYNVKVVLGTSNVSFVLPNRSILNTTYLAMALAFGLDAPITDSTNQTLMDTIRSYRVLTNQDKDCKEFIEQYSQSLDIGEKNSSSSMDLDQIIIRGLKEEAYKKLKFF